MRFLRSFIIVALLSFFQAKSQNSSELGVWVDHLSYTGGVDLVERANSIYCAVGQGIFILNKTDRDIQRLSKVNGLSDISITAMALSEATDEILVGYKNANLDIISGDRVSNIPDIRQSSNFPGLKTINHIFPYQNTAYLSTDFGILAFDLDLRIVRSTLIIGEGGNNLRVNQVVVNPKNDSIYAATDEGLYEASLNDRIESFQFWRRSNRFQTRIKHITVFDEKIWLTKEGLPINDSILFREDGIWKYFTEEEPSNFNYLKESNGNLVVCNNFSAKNYNTNLAAVYNVVSTNPDLNNPEYNPAAAIVDNAGDAFWSIDKGKGGLYFSFDLIFTQNFRPNSPISNSVYDMHYANQKVYVSPGAINNVWAPQFNNDGYYELQDFIWTNFSNSQFGDFKDIIAIFVDPRDPGHVFATSYGEGILEFQDGVFQGVINEQSTTGAMASISGGGKHRVGGFSADPEGNIWFTNGLTDRPLGKISVDGTVETIALGSVAGNNPSVKDILYTTNDQIWMQTRTAGIVVATFRDGVWQTKRLELSENQGNLPSDRVLSFAEDQDGEIWVGTDEGVGVLFSPQNIFEPNRNFDLQPILFEEDDVVQRLLGSETVNDIEVDGANKKWFATATSGVFYTSADGRTQIHNFTENNSPLLSNNVLDIEIDDVTGMVYFGTDMGIVSFQGTATEGANQHTDVFAYPNPVEPGYAGPILIRGLVTNAQVKITDIEGNIVFETVAEGGQAVWSGNSFSGERVKSGVYLAYITDDLGTATAITKIMIVN